MMKYHNEDKITVIDNTKFTYCNIHDLLNDFKKLKKDNDNSVNQFIGIDELMKQEWFNENVLEGMLSMYSVIKSNRNNQIKKNSNSRLGRRKNVKKIKQAVKLYKTNTMTCKEITKKTGVSKTTLYENIKLYIDEV